MKDARPGLRLPGARSAYCRDSCRTIILDRKDAGKAADVEDFTYMWGKAAEGKLRTACAALLRCLEQHAKARRTDVLKGGEVQDDGRSALDLLHQYPVQFLRGVAVQTTLNREDQSF